MLTEERHRIIIGELQAQGRVHAGALAARFGVSEDTVRRDLRELARTGACQKVYGGAVTPSPYAGPVAVRGAHDRAAKRALARAAVRLLAPRQSLFIDAGSTNLAIAEAIPRDMPLTVATNALGVATALAGHGLVTLVVLGGLYDPERGGSFGGETLHAVANLSADLVFLGACGIDAGRGVTAFDAREADLKRALVRQSGALVVAATTEKLATAAPFRVADAGAIRHLVVEHDAPRAVDDLFSPLGCAIHRAERH